MLFARLEQQFRRALGDAATPERDESIRFAVDFTRLLVSILADRPSEPARDAVRSAVTARTNLTRVEVDQLLELALAPDSRGQVQDVELRAFSARFGRAAGEALRAAVAEETDLAGFADRYGAAEALLLLDALFAVCAVDGIIDRHEIGRLQRYATELGIDPMLVGALFRKHDVRHASGAFTFQLDGDRYVIGRSAGAGIQLPDPQVARRHAELVRESGGWRLIDLGSGRPTLVNGVSIQSAPLRAGDQLRVGSYSLSLDRHGHTLTAFGSEGFSALSVRGLSRRIGDLRLLDDVGFTVFSGEVIAVIGPSGSGKTTLLNAITGVAPADAGDVLLDGQRFHQLLASDRSIVGIVPQDDVVHAELTVEESLTFAARLRFPPDVERKAIDQEVGRVLDELQLDHIRHQRIGDTLNRGISGGQRKRVNLGQELLTRSTKVLFLDEPTSGLDPQTAQDIVSLVRQLADGGRIVFLVTHDLSPSVLSMVDHLLVLAPGGRMAWFGPPDEACAWFGVRSPDAIFARLPEHPAEDWARRYREGQAWRKFVRTREHLLGLDGLEPAEGDQRGPPRQSAFNQYRTLTRRYLQVKLRDLSGLLVQLSQAPLLGAAMVLVFPEADTGTVFMLALSALWFGASSSVRELIADRALWRREARVGLGVVPYVASKTTVLGALVVLQCALMATIVWGMLGMGPGPGEDALGFSLPAMAGVTALTGMVGMAMGLMLSALFTSSEAAVATLPLVLIPQITFGGLLVKVKSMGTVAHALSYAMITRHAFDALIKTGEQLSSPKPGYPPSETRPILGIINEYGLKGRDAPTLDMGFSLVELCGILGLFLAGFLVAAVVLSARNARSG